MITSIAGFDDTDHVEHATTDYLFPRQVGMSRIQRGQLTVVIPTDWLTRARPEEFLWRPVKALGQVNVWWTLHRSPSVDMALDSLYQTEDGWCYVQTISRELVADSLAWQAFQRHMFQQFLWGYQQALDEQVSAE